MHKNSYIIGVAESFKVIFSKSQKKALKNQGRNWKLALFIKAISTTN